MREDNNSPSNFSNRSMSEESVIRKNLSTINNTQVGRIILVTSSSADDSKFAKSWTNRSNSEDWNNCKQKRMGISFRRASNDLNRRKQRGKQGENLFGEAIKAAGASNIVIYYQIIQLNKSWRRHRQGLCYSDKYLQIINMLSIDLFSLKYLQIFIIQLMDWLRLCMLTPAAIINAKTAISALTLSFGIPEKQIYNNRTSTSVKSERKHTAKEVKDKQTYNIDDLLKYIRRKVKQIDNKDEDELQRIKLALLMTITTRRMSEISRAALQVDSIISVQFVHHVEICKIGGEKLTQTIKKAKVITTCFVQWLTRW
ncbi:MAG: hypothetical protein EZS28_034098 [Streblomastix strix]|uniref:Tyr recombinase domain-containing protein n=1 Tax=Streblomastix strix TaxID=222440 RepID=A0A5J4UKS7_9EUKA|nr:MAG: hypothetical protein EZS28_034098 [Streblomastix strix]